MCWKCNLVASDMFTKEENLPVFHCLDDAEWEALEEYVESHAVTEFDRQWWKDVDEALYYGQYAGDG